MKKLPIILTSLVTAIILSMPLYGHAKCVNNLITNGDFKNEPSDFTTDYLYIAPTPHSLTPPGTYTVYTSPNGVHNNWAHYGDNTGSGNMLIVNAACDDGGGSGCDSNVRVVWEQTVSVSPNTEYVFTYFLSSSYDANLANISTSINGAEIGWDFAPIATGVWQKVSYNWNSGASSSATITLEDLTREYSGDDFAIDDISLCLAGEVYDLCAGQTMDVGHVQVWNDGTNLHVTYLITEPGACLSETHLHVAGPLESIPQTKKLNPIPGKFDYMMEHSCTTAYTYTIPLAWEYSDLLQIAAHAVVQMPSSASNRACANGVFDYTQGTRNDGTSVLLERRDPNKALGEPDSESEVNFYSLGFDDLGTPEIEGVLSLSFPTFISGELTVYEVTWGTYPTETADVYVSRDGADWTYLGTADNSGSGNVRPSTFQLDECIQYVKIVDMTNRSLHGATADAFDVDAVCASSTCEEETAWGGCLDTGTPFPGKNWATYFTYTVQ